eukprot:gene15316-16893_t
MQRNNSLESPVLPPITTAITTTNVVRNSPLPRDSPASVGNITRTPEPGVIVDDPEDRPIHSLKSTTQVEQEADAAQVLNGPDETGPAELSAKDEAEAGPVIDVYGMKLVQLAYSKSWSHRQEAVEVVYKELADQNPQLTFESEPKTIVRATALLLKRMLLDKVLTIFNDALKIEKYLLTDYLHLKKLGKSEYSFIIDKTLPSLLTRLGDMAARTKDLAINFILEIAVLKEVKALGVIPEMTVQPIKSKGQAPWRLFKGRLELILKLLEPLDVDKHGSFTTDGVMKIVLKGLDHSHKDVREVAIEILFVMYKKVGAPLRSHLPDDTAATRKNPLYGRIFDGFDKIDGKPTRAEKKLLAKQEKEQMENAKKTEIAALQAQLQALRAVADGISKEDGQDGDNDAEGAGM